MKIPFSDDLKDLRNIILWVAIPIFIAAFSYSQPIVEYLLIYNDINIGALVTLTPLESLETQLNLSLIIAIVVCIPLIFMGIYSFCRPAMSKRIRRMTLFYIIIGVVLALAGFGFGSTIFSSIILKSILKFQLTNTVWSIQSVVSFILSIGAAIAIIAQTVVIIPIIVNLDLIKRKTLVRGSLFCFGVILLIAGFITPPDVVSQLVISVPFYISFWVGIIISYVWR